MNTDHDDTLRAAFVSHVAERLTAIGLIYVRLGPNQMFVARGAFAADDTYTDGEIRDMVRGAPRFRIASDLRVTITIMEAHSTMRGIDPETVLASWDLSDPNCTVENVTDKIVEVVDGHTA